jgi:hypothetical protein
MINESRTMYRSVKDQSSEAPLKDQEYFEEGTQDERLINSCVQVDHDVNGCD